jgi:hypothetical protein
MPKYCSQCGKTGHNKRNRICQININKERYESIVQITHWTQGIEAKRNILNTYIIEITRELDSLREEMNLERRTSDFFYQQVDEARKAHILAQHTGPMELCLETYNRLECAEASWDIMYRNYMTLSKCKDSLREIAMNLLELWNSYREPQVPTTSEYLKEMSVILDLTASVDVQQEPEKSEDKYDCPLCYEVCEKKNIIETNCCHSYCLDCMKNFTTAIKDKTTKPSCPLCRTEIKELFTRNSVIHCNYMLHLDSL